MPLEANRQTVEGTTIRDFEAGIDRTLYELFDLTDHEREIIKDEL